MTDLIIMTARGPVKAANAPREELLSALGRLTKCQRESRETMRKLAALKTAKPSGDLK